MRRVLLVLVLLAVGACTVQKTEPFAAGAGLEIDGGTVSVNTNQVPVASGSCSEGQVLVRVDGGWACMTESGAQGATGPAGAPSTVEGPTGAQGAQGPTGPQGVQGPTGGQGLQGGQGSTGAQGAQGPTGAQGLQGAQGPSGAQGSTGPTGNGLWTAGPSGSIYYTGGNVGIGRTGPQWPLHVVGTVEIDYSAGFSDGLYIAAASGSTAHPLWVRGWDDQDLFVVRGDGNVGIGTTLPSGQLDVRDPANPGNPGLIYGVSVPRNITTTNATTTGLLGNGSWAGYGAMNTWIQGVGCAGYHQCSVEEMIRYLAIQGVPDNHKGSSPQCAWLAGGSKTGNSGMIDCSGWNSSAATEFGAQVLYYGGFGGGSPQKMEGIAYAGCDQTCAVFCCM